MKLKLQALAISTLVSLLTSPLFAAPADAPGPKRMEGQRKYSLLVRESSDSAVNEYNLQLASVAGSRSVLDDLVGMYRSTFTGQILNASSSLLGAGISAIASATRDKRPEWQAAVERESRFQRVLPMHTQILDFYRKPSLNGPLDPTDMLFSGFGCRQVIEFVNSQGETEQREVFYVSCRVRNDPQGISRMLHHSKFEVYVDSLRFNPYLCDLPNDSLGLETDKRIGFSFARRKDLQFRVDATITSSWINQAMQVHNDVKIGEFHITASIDSTNLDPSGMFVYSATGPQKPGARVNVVGDCFLVPRSYVGSSDLKNATDSWGTGQYKVEMQLTESCKINPAYYQTDGQWDKKKWNPEWKMINQRRKKPSGWKTLLNLVGTDYVGSAWVTTLTEPLKTYIIQTETGLLNSASDAMPTTKSSGASAGAPSGSPTSGGAPQGQPKK